MKAYQITEHLVINDANDIDLITVFDMRGLFDEESRNVFEHCVGTTNYIKHLRNLKNIKSSAKVASRESNDIKNSVTEDFFLESKKKYDARINKYVNNRVFDKKLMQDYIFRELEMDLSYSKEHIIKILDEYTDKSKSDKIPLNNFFESFKAKISLSLNGSILIDLRMKTRGVCLEDITLFINIFHMQSDLTHFMTYLILKKFVHDYFSFITIPDENGMPTLNLNAEIFEMKKQNNTLFDILPFIIEKTANKYTYQKFIRESKDYDELKKVAHLHYTILSTHGFKEGILKKFGHEKSREFQLDGKTIPIRCLKDLNIVKCEKRTEPEINTKQRYKDYQKQIMCFLRGTLVGRKCSDVKLIEYPVKNKKINFIKGYDLSGQEDGLCLLTSRKALIIFNKQDTYYWDGIIQAIKLMLCTKVEYTAIEYHLFKISEQIANEISKGETEILEDKNQELTNITSTLGRMRFLLVPPIVSSSGSIIKKLEALIITFNLKKIDEHIRSDIVEINSSISEAHKIGLMKHIKDSEKQIKILTILVVALTVILIVLELFLDTIKSHFHLL